VRGPAFAPSRRPKSFAAQRDARFAGNVLAIAARASAWANAKVLSFTNGTGDSRLTC
jgi:hypothetical protein